MKTEKYCPRCKCVKSIEYFGISVHSHDGFSSRCKSCRAILEKIRRSNPETKAKIKDYKQKPENKKRTKDLALQRKFKITLDVYENLLEKQNYKCYICKREVADKKNRSLAVDHCHTTGKVRGLLCTKCNKGIGYFNDNINLLQNAINYLKENEE